MTTLEIQQALIALGFDPGKADGVDGAKTRSAVKAFQKAEKLAVDGIAGPQTRAALKAAVTAKQVGDIVKEPAKPDADSIVPAAWMPAAQIKRIIMHWNAGTHRATEFDRAHYHILIEADGKLVRGIPTIDLNDARGTKKGYAAHALNTNSGSIGIAVCAMADASDSPFRVGKYPITQMQIDTICRAVAELCVAYKIAVTPQTVLSHAEIQGTLGIQQRGKIDIMWLPGMERMVDARSIGDKLRLQIKSHL